MKKLWTNPKHKGQFTGSYVTTKVKRQSYFERVFMLTNAKKTYSFESWEAAVKLGWVKVRK